MHAIGDFYIDLGTANTIIHTKNRGLLANESTILTVKNDSIRLNGFHAYGNRAKLMLGKTPSSLSLLKPLKEGVISDFDSTLKMLDFFIKNNGQRSLFQRSRLVISLPCEVAKHEKMAIIELGKSLGARQVDLLSEPLVAAIGAGLDVLESHGKMIVDIGGGTSEAAVISLGEIVVSQAKRIGGLSLDLAILDHLKSEYQFHVGEQTAEKLKVNIADASFPLQSQDFVEVGGIDLNVGLPRKLKISSEMLYKPIQAFTKDIIAIVSKTLEKCPPELAGDLVEQGIMLAGGGSSLKGLSLRIEQATGVKVTICEDPLLCTAKGGAAVLKDNKLFDGLQAS